MALQLPTLQIFRSASGLIGILPAIWMEEATLENYKFFDGEMVRATSFGLKYDLLKDGFNILYC